jgi:hypothetical protein
MALCQLALDQLYRWIGKQQEIKEAFPVLLYFLNVAGHVKSPFSNGTGEITRETPVCQKMSERRYH